MGAPSSRRAEVGHGAGQPVRWPSQLSVVGSLFVPRGFSTRLFATRLMTAPTMNSPQSASLGAPFTPATPVESGAAVAPVIVGTYKRQKPLFVRGEGVHLIDADGKRYLDFVAGIAVNALGHADAGVMNAMQQAMQTGLIHTSNLYRTEPGERLAQWLVDHSFADSVFFCNSGAEAKEGALQVCPGAGEAALVVPPNFENHSLPGIFPRTMPGTLVATNGRPTGLPFAPPWGGGTTGEPELEEP